MKKLFVLTIVIAMLFTLAACGNEQDTPNNDNTGSKTDVSEEQTNNGNSNNDNTEPVTVSLSELQNHAPSPESDFFCSDDGNGGLVLMEYLGNDEIVVIPETINGKPVTSITKYVFANECTVSAIKLSSTIQKIDGFAFTQNHSLQIVICGAALEEIGDSAFQACDSLNHIELNDGLKTIKSLAFSQCTSLESIAIPKSVETIDLIAFNLMMDGFTIIGDEGSVAESYATSQSINFTKN